MKPETLTLSLSLSELLFLPSLSNCSENKYLEKPFKEQTAVRNYLRHLWKQRDKKRNVLIFWFCFKSDEFWRETCRCWRRCRCRRRRRYRFSTRHKADIKRKFIKTQKNQSHSSASLTLTHSLSLSLSRFLSPLTLARLVPLCQINSHTHNHVTHNHVTHSHTHHHMCEHSHLHKHTLSDSNTRTHHCFIVLDQSRDQILPWWICRCHRRRKLGSRWAAAAH